jgi:hypothetical protein
LSNRDVLADLRRLRSDISVGSIDIEYAIDACDRLTYQLSGVGPEQDRTLRGLVSELEQVRFGRLRQNQAAAVDPVLERAEALFSALLA